MAGRPPKPSKVLEMTGAFKKDPQRRRKRAGEPESAGPVGGPPDPFTRNPDSPELQKLCLIWDELVADAPPGVLTRSDRIHLEVVCRLLLKVRGNYAKANEITQLNRMLGQIGMNPSDRARVQVHRPAEPADETTWGRIASRAAERRADGGPRQALA